MLFLKKTFMPRTDTEHYNVHDLTEQDSLADYSGRRTYTVPPTSPGNSSLVLDLTADELDFINDVNDPAHSGSSAQNVTILDDDAFAFFVEAGLDNPEELSMLGIDIEEIRNQRAIAERLEQQRTAGLEAALQLQQQQEREQQQLQKQQQREQQQREQQQRQQQQQRLREERFKEEMLRTKQEQPNLPAVSAESFAGPSSNLNQSSTSSSDQGSLRSQGKRRMENETAEENKRVKIEVEVKPIELIDDDSDNWIDLTNEIEGTSYGPIRVDDIDEGSSSRPINPITVSSSELEHRMSRVYDIDSDSDHDIPLDYLSFADYIRRHQDDDEIEALDYENDRYIRDPFTSGETGEFYDEFGDDSTLINILGRTGYTYTEGQGNFQRPRAPPPIMNYPGGHRQTPQEAERELRDLLEHVIFDEPPPPEDRTGTPDRLSIVLMEHQKIGLQWMLKMENSRNKGGILADDMGLGKTIQAMAVIVQNTCDDFTPVDHSLINGTGSRLTAGELHIKATLIVCPVSLIDQWRREIESKTSPPLNVLVYHGSARTQNPYNLAKYDGKIYIFF